LKLPDSGRLTVAVDIPGKSRCINQIARRLNPMISSVQRLLPYGKLLGQGS
jgi:hypothetical protein